MPQKCFLRLRSLVVHIFLVRWRLGKRGLISHLSAKRIPGLILALAGRAGLAPTPVASH